MNLRRELYIKPFGDLGVQCYFASIVMTAQMLQVLDEWQQWQLSG